MSELQRKLNLSKQVVLDLTKKKGVSIDQKALVKFCCDISGSMRNLYNRGFVQRVQERLTPIAMAFDDNSEMEQYVFHDGCIKVPEPVTINNVEGYINKYVIPRYSFGGTNYAPAITLITNEYKNDPSIFGSTTETKEEAGFLGLFKKKTTQVNITGTKAKYPAYVMFLTDGSNFDEREAERAIIEASKYGIFWQFIGLSTGDNFAFLKRLDVMSGRFIDNANFFELTQKELETLSDEELYGRLLGEFPDYLKLAKSKGIIE